AVLKMVVTLKSGEVSEEGESTPHSVSPAEQSAYEVMVEKSAARKRQAISDLTSGDEKGEERKKTVVWFPNPLKGKGGEEVGTEKVTGKIAALGALLQREGQDVASSAGGSSMETATSVSLARDIGGMTSEGVIFCQEPGGGDFGAARCGGYCSGGRGLIVTLQRMELLVKKIAEGDKDALTAVHTRLGTACKAQVTGTQFGAIRDNLKE
ncbi:hypothetical protein HDU76_010732, partial [Blyttiomyces sp. JEL0837]